MSQPRKRPLDGEQEVQPRKRICKVSSRQGEKDAGTGNTTLDNLPENHGSPPDSELYAPSKSENDKSVHIIENDDRSTAFEKLPTSVVVTESDEKVAIQKIAAFKTYKKEYRTRIYEEDAPNFKTRFPNNRDYLAFLLAVRRVYPGPFVKWKEMTIICKTDKGWKKVYGEEKCIICLRSCEFEFTEEGELGVQQEIYLCGECSYYYLINSNKNHRRWNSTTEGSEQCNINWDAL